MLRHYLLRSFPAYGLFGPLSSSSFQQIIKEDFVSIVMPLRLSRPEDDSGQMSRWMIEGLCLRIHSFVVSNAFVWPRIIRLVSVLQQMRSPLFTSDKCSSELQLCAAEIDMKKPDHPVTRLLELAEEISDETKSHSRSEYEGTGAGCGFALCFYDYPLAQSTA